MKKTGLFFGTFNPIHIGHLIIANHLAEFSDLDQVWFVVTPRSPFKKKDSLLDDYHRFQMVYEAVREYPRLEVCDAEFKLPQPNYTIDTLTHLREKHGDSRQFSLIMGEDNLKGLHKWKNYEAILDYYSIYVYPRLGPGDIPEALRDHPAISRVDAPVMELSATFIRKQHAAGKNVRPLLPEAVWKYMDEMNFYR
ncbi:nicotinate (nicotinamide) nucleotide adenylyltransferase [Robiginitalea biformata]|uniref:Probable nicotinate-nucleotide adenylyltransferase n=1 Tax=Robiginitalea biformata (strain ATCC BAA-864 / DSM 15991 / KCTC 12146 / HTCC2501) TaxID=313596 RepID=A4CHF5_ROBBH|nr:nicotinate (nicotinamide) nucleotide adenylyltransferase [Robiginitalea biformata]EAR16363.1 nicotinic acid mononucleotide adenyltransferase [Robiginitalea biformata HTCC2501]